MIRIIKLVLLVLGSVILQNSIVAHLSMFGSKASLPLVLTVSIALLKGSLYGEVVGFSSGLLCDLSSGGPFVGIQSLSQALVGFFVGLMRVRFYSESIVTQATSGFSATLFEKLISLFVLSILLSNISSPRIRLQGLLLTAVVNSMLTILVFRVLNKMLKETD